MTANFQGLKDFSVAPGERREKDRSGWEPVTLASLGKGRVIACDQSLDAFGWVYVVHDEVSLRVRAAESFSTSKPTGLKGHPLNLHRGLEVRRQFVKVLDYAYAPGTAVVYETPPAGGRMARPESSLLSALSILIACEDRRVTPEMLGAQPAKKLFTGNANADKPVAHKAMAHQCQDYVAGWELITNEAKRDALMLAFLWLSRQKGTTDGQ